MLFGVWRRLVARYLGVVEAAGSNPVTQTKKNRLTKPLEAVGRFSFYYRIAQIWGGFWAIKIFDRWCLLKFNKQKVLVFPFVSICGIPIKSEQKQLNIDYLHYTTLKSKFRNILCVFFKYSLTKCS